MPRLGLIVLAALATSTRATPWPRLDEALKNYPSIHARETARLKAGDTTAKFVLVVCYHGLGNRHHALVSAFALALARNAALYVDWPDQRCNKWAQAGDAASRCCARLARRPRSSPRHPRRLVKIRSTALLSPRSVAGCCTRRPRRTNPRARAATASRWTGAHFSSPPAEHPPGRTPDSPTTGARRRRLHLCENQLVS